MTDPKRRTYLFLFFSHELAVTANDGAKGAAAFDGGVMIRVTTTYNCSEMTRGRWKQRVRVADWEKVALGRLKVIGEKTVWHVERAVWRLVTV